LSSPGTRRALKHEEIAMKKLLVPILALMLGASVLAQTPQVDGEVKKIDKAQGRITLKHGDIKHLDMPPMTMVFRVTDPKMLDGVAVGDKVRFAADKVGGNYTVTTLSKAP
jgi:Cu(I)/Ag(I) efflux system periplasmic protein CusF